MDDVAKNALFVNATQRHASLVVQKSISEGFGLTVTEAMWKSRPVVASAVGGIVDQVSPDSGILLSDPLDLDTFGRAVVELLAQPARLASFGREGRRRVRARFLSDGHLVEFGRLLVHVSSS
jgi:trehalose synthase